MKVILMVMAFFMWLAFGSGCAVVPTQDMHGVAATVSVPMGAQATPVVKRGFFAAVGQTVSDNPVASSVTVAGLSAVIVTAYQAYNHIGAFSKADKSSEAADLSAIPSQGPGSFATRDINNYGVLVINNGGSQDAQTSYAGASGNSGQATRPTSNP